VSTYTLAELSVWPVPEAYDAGADLDTVLHVLDLIRQESPALTKELNAAVWAAERLAEARP
jgi:hypothetical protein